MASPTQEDSEGQGSLVCCSSYGHKELDTFMVVRSLPAMQETWVLSLGWEDPLEEEMATHSSILAGKESTCNVGDLGLVPGFRRSPGEGKVYPL